MAALFTSRGRPCSNSEALEVAKEDEERQSEGVTVKEEKEGFRSDPRRRTKVEVRRDERGNEDPQDEDGHDGLLAGSAPERVDLADSWSGSRRDERLRSDKGVRSRVILDVRRARGGGGFDGRNHLAR